MANIRELPREGVNTWPRIDTHRYESEVYNYHNPVEPMEFEGKTYAEEIQSLNIVGKT